MTERLSGDLGLVQEVVDSALRDLPGEVENVAAAITAKDAPEVDHHLHIIQGIAANLAAPKLQQETCRMADWLETIGLDSIETRLPTLRAAAHELCERLQRELSPAT
ncbi:MAG: Hpt domain-containing protein [Opitutales bacterium]|nr:Hpt domain-containing protein [Opitutales bacterium]